MLSRRYSLLPFALGFLLAAPASAISTTYTLVAGSMMAGFNRGCLSPPTSCTAPVTVPVTGSVTLDDDGVGNVTLTDMSLSHGPYEVGQPPISSLVLERPSITLAAGSLVGTGSTLTSAMFGPTVIAQQGGTLTCTDLVLTCTLQGWTAGVTALPMILVDLGAWTFSGGGANLYASFAYSSINAPQGVETLTLIASVPEPGTALLVGLGLACMTAVTRRARVDARGKCPGTGTLAH